MSPDVRLESPDAVYFRWRELRLELEAPSAPLTSRYELKAAVRPSSHCPSCGHEAVAWRQDRAPARGTGTCTPDTENDPLAAPFEATCLRCGSAWPLVVVPTLELEHRSPLDRRLAELATLGEVLRRGITEPERRVYLQLFLEEQVGGFERVACEAAQRWPDMPPPWHGTGPRAAAWSVRTVRTVVLHGRRRILDGMIRAGLWRFA